ncbi:MAG: hypothetical protein DIZ80_00045 [endosymbiont of Galathealinum brachiosum]|uniref:HTH araC/xylS-type domain-containing protein n=1 Tax=endosymbiont of Galathealinum brachiosum TaxID=2200906 RepID=A0A370DNE9_9GAMM|nr:MAG: hypothetical protein DIZ80_00045 [endosymbiont of Galathealinum brachiosum]
MDLLSDLLSTFRLSASIFHNAQYYGDWSIHQEYKGITFHMISHGKCWLHIDNSSQHIKASTGDILLFPREVAHSFSKTKESGSETIDVCPLDYSSGVKKGSTGLFCGHMYFDHSGIEPLLKNLPEVIILRRHKGNDQWIKPLLVILENEHQRDNSGQKIVFDKLAEIIFVQSIRAYIADNDQDVGIIAALSDTKLSKALTLIHEQPSTKWTVDSLASNIGMSRSNFAEHFKRVLNQSPIKYLEWWRMQLAWNALADKKETIIEVALVSGYSSEAAFSKAFKRVHGVNPGQVRR